MPDDVVDVNAASSPADVTAAPSAEVAQAPVESQPSEPTPPSPSQPAAPTEEPRVPYSRFQEVNERAKQAEAMAQQAMAALQRVQALPPTGPTPDPLAELVNHPDPATAQFWRTVERVSEAIAEKKAQALLPQVTQQVQTLARRQVQMTVQQFRKENPDIKVGSPEETAIANLVTQGWDLDTARKLTLYDKLEAENRAFKAKHSSVATKVLANGSEASSGIPATAGLPKQPGDWRDNVRQAFRKGGGLSDIVNAAGAHRAT